MAQTLSMVQAKWHYFYKNTTIYASFFVMPGSSGDSLGEPSSTSYLLFSIWKFFTQNAIDAALKPVEFKAFRE